MSRQTLFEIGEDLMALDALLAEVGGDVTDAQVDAAVTAWFAELGGTEGEKLDRYVGLVRQNEMEAAAAKEEAERWAMRAQARTNAAKRLKDRLRLHLEQTGRMKVATAAGRAISLQANGGKTPVLFVDGTDLRTLPAAFQRVRVEADTDAVREALERGEPLAFATLGDRGFHLRIR